MSMDQRKRGRGAPRRHALGSMAQVYLSLPVPVVVALREASAEGDRPQWEIVDEAVCRFLGIPWERRKSVGE